MSVVRSITRSKDNDKPSEANKGRDEGGKDTVATLKQLGFALAIDVVQITAAYLMARYLVSQIQGKNGDAPTGSPSYDDLDDEENEKYNNSIMGKIRNMWFRVRPGQRDQDSGYGTASDGESGVDVDPAFLRKRQIRQILASVSNPHERAIASDVIDPDKITVKFHNIGGIDHVKAELWELVVLPLIKPDLFKSESGLVTPPRGILLYGQPGTGKTMLAKAIAKESGAAFVNVRLSSIMNKWFGESNKLVAATFSLAQKLAPSIIFIDEIDTFLKNRDGDSNDSAVGSMKSEFLTLWDGMLTDNVHSKHVVVLAATNRPYDVDSAVLRRLPRSFEIGLPNESSRLDILNLFLQRQSMTEEARTFIPTLAKRTEGYSGSDLKELCRAAAMEPIREVSAAISHRHVMQSPQDRSASALDKEADDSGNIRAVDKKDFDKALQRVKRTGEAATNYKRSTSRADSDMNVDLNGVMRGLAMFQQLNDHLRSSSGGGGGDGDEDDSADDASTADDVPNI